MSNDDVRIPRQFTTLPPIRTALRGRLTLYSIPIIIGVSLVSTMGLTPLNRPPEAPTSPVETVSVTNPFLTRDDIISYIKTKDWNPERAVAIANCESGLNPLALNDNPRTGDYSVGVFQVNIKGDLAKNRPSEEELKDPIKNIDFSYSLWKRNGWSDWSCSRRV